MSGMVTLTLNADGQPISVVPISAAPWQEAIKLLFVDRVEVLAEYDDWEVHSPSMTVKVPSVIMLHDYIKVRRAVKFSKENVFLRDGFDCQYCGINGRHDTSTLTMDHVVPRFLGGKTNFANISTACFSCNLEKSHYTKMKPKNAPKKPTYYELAAKSMTMPITIPHESWIDYLGWPNDLITVRPPNKRI